jgi:hypothetical protein
VDTKFPTLQVFKGAALAPLSYVSGLIKTYLIVALAMAVSYFYAASNGIDMDVLKGFMNPDNAEAMQQHLGPFFKTFLLALLLLGGASAFVFNFWVRFGAKGSEGTPFSSAGTAVGAMLVNMLKFFFVFMLIGIVGGVVSFMLGSFGIGGDAAVQADAMAAGDLRTMTTSGFVANLINLIIVCAIYSWFSANLTQTALASKKEGLEHPHTIDFGIVIFLIYMVLFIPSTLAGLTGSWTLSIVLQLILGTYVAFSIAVAHGLRYRICTQDLADQADET